MLAVGLNYTLKLKKIIMSIMVHSLDAWKLLFDLKQDDRRECMQEDIHAKGVELFRPLLTTMAKSTTISYDFLTIS